MSKAQLPTREREVYDLWIDPTYGQNAWALATALGIQEPSVRRYLRKLREKGWLDNGFRPRGVTGVFGEGPFTTEPAKEDSTQEKKKTRVEKVLDVALDRARSDLRATISELGPTLDAIYLGEGTLLSKCDALRTIIEEFQHTCNEIAMHIECLQHAAGKRG